MNAVVVDTDVASMVFKGDDRAETFRAAVAAHDLLISCMTEAELERWVLQAKWGSERIIRFRTYMKRFGTVRSSRDLVVKWAEVMVVARSMGRRIEVADARVAATALLYDAPLITNNPGDYLGVTGIRLLSR